jgi:hypothetical protein
MMNIPRVAIHDWKELYTTAIEFRDLKPWEWMSSADLFAVKHPETGEIAYCCIMGELGEVFSLTAYLGQEGLQSHIALSAWTEEITLEMMNKPKCLMTTFENRETLDKKDLADIKKLGLTFRGKQQWPLFRTLDPGFVPWFLNTEQVQFMTLLLKQAIFIAQSVLKTPDLIVPEIEKCTARIPVTKNGHVEWHTEVIDVDVEEEIFSVPQYANEINLKNLRKNLTSNMSAPWGIDWFYLPTQISDGERPYFPTAVIIIDGGTSSIITFELSQIGKVYETIQNKLIEAIEKHNGYPKLMYVDKPEVAAALKKIATALGIDFDFSTGHYLFEDVKEHMINHFMNM